MIFLYSRLVINSVDNTELPCYALPPTLHHTFIQKLTPFTPTMDFLFKLDFQICTLPCQCRTTSSQTSLRSQMTS